MPGHDLPADARQRVRISGLQPWLDCGRFDVKRILGDLVSVECDLLADGHDRLAGELRSRRAGTETWDRTPLEALTSDRWRASFPALTLGRYEYQVEAWIDVYGTWRAETEAKARAGQPIDVELRTGAALLEAAAARAEGAERSQLQAAATRLVRTSSPVAERLGTLDGETDSLARRHADRSRAATTPSGWVRVDPRAARYSTWYELFPRSTGEAGRHGTFRDVEARLGDLRELGFDVLYLPPIHPIGRAFRKGKNNAPTAAPDDPGSPWAIGSPAGGHTAVHPELGTLDDFRHLVAEARRRGLAIALDIAFQASPDHPWVREHPEWFVHRADGSIQFAENPPKKYEDIYPFDFQGDGFEGLWQALLDVFLFWVEQGVTIFRVDNPHTKPLPFWEWCLGRVKEAHPEVLFLAEAFTRPAVMYGLAKLGFSQSYTYFTWRTTREEIERYLTEITRPPVSDFFRPNLWPSTPDILPEHLQVGGRAAFAARLVLAGTLSSSYGVYGPAFELMEHAARAGTEEYDRSEKYEIRQFAIPEEGGLRDLIARLNAIRRDSPALQGNDSLTFHPTSNSQLLCYSKRDAAAADAVLVVVNLDPNHTQRGALSLNLGALGVASGETFQAHDQLSDLRVLWSTSSPEVEIDPQLLPARIFRVRHRSRTERDFEYFT